MVGGLEGSWKGREVCDAVGVWCENLFNGGIIVAMSEAFGGNGEDVPVSIEQIWDVQMIDDVHISKKCFNVILG